MTARSILLVFQVYQKARVNFVQTVAELASRPNTIECLDNAGVLDLLKPLLTDVVPSIQQVTAIALGRLANHDEKIAQAIVRKDILPQLLKNIDKQNKYYKRAALFVLRGIAKHSPETAAVVVHTGGLEATIICLEDFETGVKEAAAWAIGYIARHNKQLAETIADSGAIPLLVLCLQEPELCLKQISASALCDIGKHSVELAQEIVDGGAIPFLAKAICNPDVRLKRQSLAALGNIAKHSLELAEAIVEAEILPDVLIHMGHPDEHIARASATLTREICKHSIELSQFIVNNGGIAALIELIGTSKSSAKLPAVMALGYIAGHSDQLAIAVIASKAIIELAAILEHATDQHLLAVCVWTFGQIGKHSSEHAKAVAVANVFPKIIQLYNNPSNSEDLRTKCQTTLKQVLQKCMHIEALEPLLKEAPSGILKYVLGQFSKILPNDPKARRLFVTSGGLRKVQEIQSEPGSTLSEYINIINCCFPQEIVRYYSPGYPETLLEAVEQYKPDCETFMGNRKFSSEFTDSNVSLSKYKDQHEEQERA